MKHLSTKTQFKEAISYLKESSKYIYYSIGVFVISAIIGLVFKENLTFIDELLKGLIAKTIGLNAPEMIFFILQNNLQSALLSVFLGIFLGIFPLFSSVTNGVVLGYVMGRSLEVSSILVWWRLLPHGIFELPAIFISFGLGIKLGFSILLPKKIRIKEFKRRFYNSFNVFLMIIIPLLIIAAIIEGIAISFLS